MTLSPNDIQNAIVQIETIEAELARLKSRFVAAIEPQADDLSPRSPLNKNGERLTARGIEVCYRLFDMGKTRYAVKEAMDISYGAATHRYHAWKDLGGINRPKQPLD